MLNKKALIRIITVLILYITAIILHYTVAMNKWLDLSIFIALYLACGYDILYGAIRKIFKGQIFDENFLMALATIGAFIIGEYVDAVAVMILFQIGELFQNYAVNRSRKSISQLMNICPQQATIVKDDNTTIDVHPEEVSVGDIILVKAGEKIALDGIVIDGSSHLDLSALNGEWQLKAVNTGDTVLSGSINTENVLKVKVTQPYEDSTVMRILQLVEEASDNKAPAENFITKFSRYYTPIVVISALLLAIIPSIFDNQWAIWTKRAMMFLFVSCPCALVISVPMTFFGGIGCASKYGILVKGGNYLEKLSHIDTVVLDKTGTLTQGKFAVKEVLPQEKANEILNYATIAESVSTHPIALSILNHTQKQINISQYDYTEIKGKGIVATLKDNPASKIICGSSKLLEENNIKFENDTENSDCTVVYVAKDSQYIGKIIIADILKSDSKDALQQLKKLNIKTIMLTGDNQNSAQRIADEVGIKDFYAQLLPHEKVDKLEEIMQDKKRTVAFVGDGINDAPSLMRADIGIAMGGIGSDSAIEASDIVLINDNLSAIPLAKKIANKTVSIAKQNIIFAIAIKIAVLILSAIGIVDNIIIAILADVGVSIIAILNAMRALKFRKPFKSNTTEKQIA